jgi:hypothetical protein
MTITEALKDRLIDNCHGSYANIDLQVLSIDAGIISRVDTIAPGCWIVAEDAYAYTIRFVNEDLSLTVVDWE